MLPPPLFNTTQSLFPEVDSPDQHADMLESSSSSKSITSHSSSRLAGIRTDLPYEHTAYYLPNRSPTSSSRSWVECLDCCDLLGRRGVRDDMTQVLTPSSSTPTPSSSSTCLESKAVAESKVPVEPVCYFGGHQLSPLPVNDHVYRVSWAKQ